MKISLEGLRDVLRALWNLIITVFLKEAEDITDEEAAAIEEKYIK